MAFPLGSFKISRRGMNAVSSGWLQESLTTAKWSVLHPFCRRTAQSACCASIYPLPSPSTFAEIHRLSNSIWVLSFAQVLSDRIDEGISRLIKAVSFAYRSTISSTNSLYKFKIPFVEYRNLFDTIFEIAEYFSLSRLYSCSFPYCPRSAFRFLKGGFVATISKPFPMTSGGKTWLMGI